MFSTAKAFLTKAAAAGLVGNPFTDAFATFDNVGNWPNSYGASGPSIVGGRLRVVAGSEFSQAASANRFDLSVTPIWVQIPTVPAAGNGSKITAFTVAAAGNTAGFYIQGSTYGLYSQGTGITGTNVTYNSTTHQWVRLSLSAGNLLFEISADGTSWSTFQSVTAPAWITSNLLAVMLSTGFYGTETAGTFAEFDNFRL